MSNMLYGAAMFNGDISEWDVSKCHQHGFCSSSTAFNGDISKWNVSLSPISNVRWSERSMAIFPNGTSLPSGAYVR
jgi:hypothetical protein